MFVYVNPDILFGEFWLSEGTKHIWWNDIWKITQILVFIIPTTPQKPWHAHFIAVFLELHVLSYSLFYRPQTG